MDALGQELTFDHQMFSNCNGQVILITFMPNLEKSENLTEKEGKNGDNNIDQELELSFQS